MIRFLNSKNKRGFTLPEIIAGALIITIASAGTYSVYIVARQFGERFRHRTMAMHGAAQIADTLRYQHRFSGPALVIPSGSTAQHYDSKNAPVGLLDVSGWQVSNEVNGLKAEYNVSYAWFVNGTEQNTDPDYDGDGNPATTPTGSFPTFKKIVVTIKWGERK